VSHDDDASSAYRALYERAPCGLMSTSASGLSLRVNRTLSDWLGHPAQDIVGKRRFQDLLTMGSKIFHQTHWLPLLQMQGSVAEVQFELLTSKGDKLPVLVNARRLEDAGEVRHDLALFVAHDRRKYERELLHARKEAEELLARERAAQEALLSTQGSLQRALEQRATLAEQLIGIVSHDLRTPMNAIVLGANLLSSSELTQRDRRTLERVVSAARRATRLIGDLLDFTQARLGGGLRVATADVDLACVVEECVEELRLSWPGRMIEHHCESRGSCLGDADRLAQVVINLVNNALTYGDPMQPVRVSTHCDDGGLALSVHNRGTPIPESLLPHIFEPLRRGESQVKLGLRSVGLGLYIVHEIVAAHGGTIRVRSSHDAGTTFTVHIPGRSLEEARPNPD
jgi:sigma-B regulation protein RsbU (phosphoserine phosphatase)